MQFRPHSDIFAGRFDDLPWRGNGGQMIDQYYLLPTPLQLIRIRRGEKEFDRGEERSEQQLGKRKNDG